MRRSASLHLPQPWCAFSGLSRAQALEALAGFAGAGVSNRSGQRGDVGGGIAQGVEPQMQILAPLPQRLGLLPWVQPQQQQTRGLAKRRTLKEHLEGVCVGGGAPLSIHPASAPSV